MITYYPNKVFNTVKDIERLCKEAQKIDKDLRYQVLLGEDEIQLHLKHLEYHVWVKHPADNYGEIVAPELSTISSAMTTWKAQSPPQGRQPKRSR